MSDRTLDRHGAERPSASRAWIDHRGPTWPLPRPRTTSHRSRARASWQPFMCSPSQFAREEFCHYPIPLACPLPHRFEHFEGIAELTSVIVIDALTRAVGPARM